MLGGRSSLLSTFQRFDVFPKTKEEVRVKTRSGAIVSSVALVAMLLLFWSELSFYLDTDLVYDVEVDTTHDKRLKINVDLLVKTDCALLSTDLMDASGESRHDVSDTIHKEPVVYRSVAQRISDRLEQNAFHFRNVMSQNTLQKLKAAAARNAQPAVKAEDGEDGEKKDPSVDGCRIFGSLDVKRVPGNFHFAAGRSFSQHGQHVHDMKGIDPSQLNLTHNVVRLSFGQEFDGIRNPLDNTEQRADHGYTMFQYFVKIVPTLYRDIRGNTIDTNQFSVTKFARVIDHSKGSHGLPGIFIKYDISAVKVLISEHGRSFAHFLTNLCAIIGGVFTVSGMIDSFVYHVSKKLNART